MMYMNFHLFFFFQAEDGIRDLTVTGVQTCALPIFEARSVAAETLEPRPTGRAHGAPPSPWLRRESASASQSVAASTRSASCGCGHLLPSPRGLGRSARVQIGRASCRERVLILVGAG